VPHNRIEIPDGIRSAVLVASDHTCCKCEERGQPVQIHHIDENPANNSPSNLAVLCLHCHNETQLQGGFGRRLSASDVRLYRDQWIERVAKRKRDADALFLHRASGRNEMSPRHKGAPEGRFTTMRLKCPDLEALIEQLPSLLTDAYAAARNGWDHGNTIDINRATYGVIEVVRGMWLRLASEFPPGHLGECTPAEYLSEYERQRYQWHAAMAEPHGLGTGGTIKSILTNRGVLQDLERSVVDMAGALRGLGYNANASDRWLERWNTARQRH
jgi:hypothetical protein